MKFEELYYGDIFTLPNNAGLGVYMKSPNVIKDDENKLQKNTVSLCGVWRGDVRRFSGSQEVIRLDKKAGIR